MKSRRSGTVMVGLSLSMLQASLATSIANVGLPTLAQVFDASFQAVQWVVLAYLLAITTLIVSVGRLGDIVGRRRLLLGGIGLFTVASGLCGLAPHLWFLVAARAAQGLGAAVVMALTVAVVGQAVPKEKTGRAMGLLGTMSACGTALGPVLGGILIALFDWRAIFLVSVPLGAGTLVLAYRTLPPDSPMPIADRPEFDMAGTVLLALTLAAYALAMTLGQGEFGRLNAALLAGTLVAGTLFAVVQARVPSPLVRLTVLCDPVLAAGLTVSALVSTVMMTTLVVGPFYLSGALALDAIGVGVAVSAGPAVAALAGVPAGRLADRFGARRMTAIGLFGIAAGCLALALVPPSWGIAGYIGPIVCVTSSYALFQVANNTAVMTDVGAEQRGMVSGLLSLSRNLGLMTGAAAMGGVFAVAQELAKANLAAPDAVAAGMRATFASAAILVIIAIFVARTGRVTPARPA